MKSGRTMMIIGAAGHFRTSRTLASTRLLGRTPRAYAAFAKDAAAQWVTD